MARPEESFTSKTDITYI